MKLTPEAEAASTRSTGEFAARTASLQTAASAISAFAPVRDECLSPDWHPLLHVAPPEKSAAVTREAWVRATVTERQASGRLRAYL